MVAELDNIVVIDGVGGKIVKEQSGVICLPKIWYCEVNTENKINR